MLYSTSGSFSFNFIACTNLCGIRWFPTPTFLVIQWCGYQNGGEDRIFLGGGRNKTTSFGFSGDPLSHKLTHMASWANFKSERPVRPLWHFFFSIPCVGINCCIVLNHWLHSAMHAASMAVVWNPVSLAVCVAGAYLRALTNRTWQRIMTSVLSQIHCWNLGLLKTCFEYILPMIYTI